MKNCLLVAVFLFFGASVTWSQSVQRGFSFQGYARDLEGAALASQSITVRFSIYPKNGSNEFQEEQNVTTDPYGVFQLVIGATKLSDFSKINFGAKDYWLRVESKANGSDYAEISNTQLLAVPFAKSAENGLPPGTILPFAGSKANVPAGFLACDGSVYSSAAYPDLYLAIGSSWGGDASSFRVPDLRGYFLRGANESTGVDPDASSRTAKYTGGKTGDNVGSYQDEQTKSHTHTGTTNVDGAHTHNSIETARADNDDNDSPHNFFTPEDANYYEGHADIPTTGSAHSHNFTTNATGGSETRPKNAAVLYIIKY